MARRPNPSRPVFGNFDDVETAAADVRVREGLGLSTPTYKHGRARGIGLRHDTQPDGSRVVVGVCHAHNTPGALGMPWRCATLTMRPRAAAGAAWR